MTNSEVSDIYLKSGLANQIKILGKSTVIDADAVVLCTGAATPGLLKDVLKLGCPILPVKSYSFDIPTEYPPFMFSFDAFTAVWLKEGVLRIRAGADLVGNSTSFD